MAEAAKAQKKKSGNRITRYFREVKSEMKKVVWPTKNQVVKNTLIVLAVVAIFGVIIYGLDLLFGWGISEIITK